MTTEPTIDDYRRAVENIVAALERGEETLAAQLSAEAMEYFRNSGMAEKYKGDILIPLYELDKYLNDDFAHAIGWYTSKDEALGRFYSDFYETLRYATE